MIKTDKSFKDTYKFYCNKAENNFKLVNLKNYLKINNMFSQFLFKLLLDGFRIALPDRLGDMHISGRKIQRSFDEEGNIKLPPDWGATKKLWKRSEKAKKEGKVVRHLNNIVYKLKWTKYNVALVNKHFIQFRLSRSNKRAIAKGVKKGNEYIIDNVK